MNAIDQGARSRRDFMKVAVLAAPAVLGIAGTAEAVPTKRRDISLRFISSAMPLVRRVDWAARSPVRTRLRLAGFPSRVTVHHAGTTVNVHTSQSSIVRDLNGVLEAHLAHRYGDIGYHFVVDYAGRVWEGRSLSYEGAHVSCQNEGNIGIMCLGNFERQYASAAQLGGLRRLVCALRTQFDIPVRRVYGHRDIGASLCPGRYLYPHVDELRAG